LKTRAWELERERQRMKELLTGSRAETGGMKKQGRGDRERQRERNKRGGKQQIAGSRGRKCERGAGSHTGRGWRNRPAEVTGYGAEREELKIIRTLRQTERDGENKNGDG